MAKSNSVETQLSRLSALALDADSPEAESAFRQALTSKINLLVAKAAKIVGEHDLKSLAPELVLAFDRFLEHPDTDKGCSAKTEIMRTLYSLGRPEPELYLRGIRHVQMEGNYGGSDDVAAELRGLSAMALVRMGYREVLQEIVPLMVDPEPTTRVLAVKAVAYADRPEGALLLRLKALTGDREGEVISECFMGLLSLTPVAAVDFVAQFLDSGDSETAESAALALGSSRDPRAFAALRDTWVSAHDPEMRRVLLVSMGLMRQEISITFLLSVIKEQNARNAAEAVAALSVHKSDETIRGRVKEAVASRSDASARAAYEKHFEM